MCWEIEYNKWIENVQDSELLDELNGMNEKDKEDAFYQDLLFGTGGLRGIIGAGTNRINIYTVAKASQGLSRYLLSSVKGQPSVVIGYDSRIKSTVFAKIAASVFAANDIKVWIWNSLNPVPTVSFGTRELKASQGIMITASHNPSNYNGYKVYGADGCQITNDAASKIYTEIEKIDIFSDIKYSDYYDCVRAGIIQYIPDSVMDNYIDAIKSQSVLFGDYVVKNVNIVYSPLNGAGLIPVTRVLRESGFTNVTVVEEQKEPDGNFPTCPYPNPEIKEAMALGLSYCEQIGADLLFATDPDADRCGVAVKTCNGNYQLLSGNEIGIILLDYLCSQRIKHGMMPEKPIFIKTIVTSDLAEKIAGSYGVDTVNVLTGFKYIGEQIGRLEAEDREADFICGFEESYGYLTGTYVRDKDAVNAAFIIAEMFAFYKTRGISLTDKLNEIYKVHGYCLNTLHSFEFHGPSGMNKMMGIMSVLRKGLKHISDQKVIDTDDYSKGINGLPEADVIRFLTSDYSVVVRPSGTEPKIKIYISINDDNEALAIIKEKEILNELRSLFQ